ncbi:ABC transporter ATP-binding protein [Candidatus Bathyarchaeota archaeon]|nr:MAG: ABC transporter ATP-binding protein [Candidatus Bathyarchaeota archaeon]
MISIFKIRLDYWTEQQLEELDDRDPSSEEYAIETENVTKKYIVGSNVITAVNGISLKVKKGEFVSIMGPSGSGKSTLLNLIGALDRPTSGRVLIDGVDISRLDDKELARLRNRKIGFVFQSYNLIARSTVKRNMELPALVSGLSKKERLKRIRELLDVVGLSGKMDRKPKTLSGGEQQRVAIARALMNNPEIILADEPTGNVDSKTGRTIMNFFRKLNRERGTTMLIVTHDPEIARMTDRIIYIRDGRIFKEERKGR